MPGPNPISSPPSRNCDRGRDPRRGGRVGGRSIGALVDHRPDRRHLQLRIRPRALVQCDRTARPGEALIGAIRQDSADETWTGRVGAGRAREAWRNGVRLAPLPDRALHEIAVATYLHPTRFGDPTSWSRGSPRVAAPQRCGCSARVLRYRACRCRPLGAFSSTRPPTGTGIRGGARPRGRRVDAGRPAPRLPVAPRRRDPDRRHARRPAQLRLSEQGRPPGAGRARPR